MAGAGISRRPLSTIDKDHVVSLSVPAPRDVVDNEIQTHVTAVALGVQNDEVILAREVGLVQVAELGVLGTPSLDRCLGHPAPLGVKAAGIRRQPTVGVLLIVDVVPKQQPGNSSVIFQRDTRSVGKGHGQVRNHGIEIPAAKARIYVHGDGMEVA